MATASGQAERSGGLNPWRVPCALYALLLAVIAWTPGTVVEAVSTSEMRAWDNPVHTLLFVPLGMLGMASAHTANPIIWLRASLTIIACTLYGLLLEIGQCTLPGVGRQFCMSDVWSNGLGATIGTALSAFRRTNRTIIGSPTANRPTANHEPGV